MAEENWSLRGRTTKAHEYDTGGRLLGVRTTVRDDSGGVIYEAFASAEDLERAGRGAGPAERAPESPRAVFEALLERYDYDYFTVGGSLDEQIARNRAEWLARYDAAVTAEPPGWIPTSAALPALTSVYPTGPGGGYSGYSDLVAYVVRGEPDTKAGVLNVDAHRSQGRVRAYFDDGGEGLDSVDADQVTHWRPMPAPPTR